MSAKIEHIVIEMRDGTIIRVPVASTREALNILAALGVCSAPVSAEESKAKRIEEFRETFEAMMDDVFPGLAKDLEERRKASAERASRPVYPRDQMEALVEVTPMPATAEDEQPADILYDPLESELE